MVYKAFANPASKYINPDKDSPSSSERYNLNKRAREFKDISLSFAPHPITKDLTILRNERAINNAVKNLILYHFGEVPYQHNVGSDVRNYMFEVVDAATASLIEDSIEKAIERYEPRITIKGEANVLPYNLGEVTSHQSYTNQPGTARNVGNATINQYLKENDRNLGVYAEVNDEQNNIEVTIIYKIVGYDKVFVVNHILYPTRA